ncbi:MAG: type II secretion system ATPase GspE [Candidatus Algichlamydia australiensis]|nr:type II secretion system ATPase GspE [Chlamydiales bacterium]
MLPPSTDSSELAEKFGITTIACPQNAPFVKEQNRLLPYAFAKEKLALALSEKEGVVQVAFASPLDFAILEQARLLIGGPIEEVFCEEELLISAIEQCYHQGEGEASAYLATLQEDEKLDESDEEYDLLASDTASPVIRMLNMMLTEAIKQGASDIHFEPQEKGLVVRYRIDGVLQKRHTPPRDLQGQLITRIKVMAKLDIAEHRLPQDGRIKLHMAGREIDFRVSTVPIVYGERVVLRILDKGNIVLGLDKIQMPETFVKNFQRLTRQSQGIVLVTGPTGSGKTTTLYSALSDVNSEDVNIMTIEDPVEFKLPGMAQIGVNHKISLSFARGLRHILRQDPDIIMIGEIRDKETAEIAIQSSLTGHLVLSTLHTNDAPSALTRMIDMGIEPYLLSSSILGVLAQRLVRTLCPFCKESYFPSKEELADLHCPIDGKMVYKPRGCNECFHSGYKGRRGIFELMHLTGAIKKQMMHSADSSDLMRVAREGGMATLRESGIKLIEEGVTSIAEVLRVTRGIEVD